MEIKNMAKISDFIKETDKALRLGYSYDIKDSLSKLQRYSEIIPSKESNTTGNGIMGLGTTGVSSVNVRKFTGLFSDDIDDPIWRVELSYSHSLPLVKEGSYFMGKINGESQNTIFSDFQHKVIPGALTEENAQAAKNSLGSEGFKVGCLLDMSQIGVDYLNRFFSLPINPKWNSSHSLALVNAGCLYAEVINGTKGTAVPMRIIGSLKNRSGSIKVVSSIACLNILKNMGMQIIVKGGGISNVVGDGSSVISFPCNTSNYDYLKAEISDYNPTNFLDWCRASGGVTVHHEVLQPTRTTSESGFFVRLFIPESMKDKAEFALAGKGFTIPENLYKTSSQINYAPGTITYTNTAITDISGNTFEAKITDLTTKLFIATGGGVANKGEGTIIYNQSLRPHTVVPNKSIANPYTDTKRRQIFEILKVINPNHHFTYDCSSFVQVLIYSVTGLKTNSAIVTTSRVLTNSGANHMNQYLPDNYEAVMLNFDINSLEPGDILTRDGHCALFVGKNGYAGADDFATVEMHGINNSKKYTLKGTVSGQRTKFTKIIRIREKNSNNTPS